MSLGVEQRKRLTIGVELAAKPELLLFLDEPTSGLDAQSAFSIVRFLRKLPPALVYAHPAIRHDSRSQPWRQPLRKCLSF